MSLLHRIKEEAVRIKTISPRYLQLEISKNCNLKCVGCYRQDNTSCVDLKGERSLTLKAIQETLAMIPTVRTVTFLGDGEPLMAPELGKILRYLADKGINSWITTNGTLLTPGIVKEWEASRVTEAHISIDSAHRDVYEQIRVGASYDDVINALSLVGKSRVPLYINFLAYEQTIADLPDIVRMAMAFNAKGINVLHPIFLTGSDLEGMLTRAKNTRENQEYIREAFELGKAGDIYWIGGKPSLAPHFRHCNLPFALPYITLGGDVYGCCYAVGAGRTEWYGGIPKKVDSDDYLMGNIHDTPFKDIWFGDEYKELRSMVKSTEQARGTKIDPLELQELREYYCGRFSYCMSCLWRWGVAC